MFVFQNTMLDTLNEKVGEVHCSCVDDRITNLNTLEKVANIEKFLSSLLESLVSIPEEKLQKIKKVKDSEKRTRYLISTLFDRLKRNMSENF